MENEVLNEEFKIENLIILKKDYKECFNENKYINKEKYLEYLKIKTK